MKIKNRNIKLILTCSMISFIFFSGIILSSKSLIIKNLKLKENTNVRRIKRLEQENKRMLSKLKNKENDIIKMKEKLQDLEFNNVVFNPNNITEKSNLNGKQLKILFKSNSTYKNLIGLEDAFIQAEKEYGVNAIFLLGIVSQESGFVTSRRAIEENNLTGYAIYQNSSEKAFNSKYESIMDTSKLLKEEYILGRNIKDIEDINEVYCPNDDYYWSTSIQKIISTYLSELNIINSCFKEV